VGGKGCEGTMAGRRRRMVYILVFFAGLEMLRIVVSPRDSRRWISRLEPDMGSLQPSRSSGLTFDAALCPFSKLLHRGLFGHGGSCTMCIGIDQMEEKTEKWRLVGRLRPQSRDSGS
jgi:hypothetical protein